MQSQNVWKNNSIVSYPETVDRIGACSVGCGVNETVADVELPLHVVVVDRIGVEGILWGRRKQDHVKIPIFTKKISFFSVKNCLKPDRNCCCYCMCSWDADSCRGRHCTSTVSDHKPSPPTGLKEKTKTECSMERSQNFLHPGWKVPFGLHSILDERSPLDFLPSWMKGPLLDFLHPGWKVPFGLHSILDERSPLDFLASWMQHPFWTPFHPGWNSHDVPRSSVLKTLPKTPKMQSDDILMREFLRNVRWMAIVRRFSPWVKIYSRKAMGVLLCVNMKNDSERFELRMKVSGGLRGALCNVPVCRFGFYQRTSPVKNVHLVLCSARNGWTVEQTVWIA